MSDNTEDEGTEPRSPLPPADPKRTEPRRHEYPFRGLPKAEDQQPAPTAAAADDAAASTLRRVSVANIGLIEYLDAWVDKGVADGTLSIARGAEYREAIAARCAELGEVPHRRENVQVLSMKVGDILAIIAPVDNQFLMAQMGEYTKEFLEYVGVDGVEVVVFPPGTELRVLDRQEQAPPTEEAPPKIDIQVYNKPSQDPGASSARIRAVMADEVRHRALYGHGRG